MQQLTLDWNQRWNHGRASYRPPRETIRKTDYDVALIPDDTTARAFVVQHHYSRSVPAMRYRVGLYRHGRLVGVAIFSHPCSDAVLTNIFPVSPLEAVELGRFVLTDDEPGNAESFFLGRAFALIARQGIRGVVSFADPFPRTDLTGNSVLIGHTGTIYQAHNGIYLGRATPRTLHLLLDGRVLTIAASQRFAVVNVAGTLPPSNSRPSDSPHLRPGRRIAPWLRHALDTVTRRVRQPGCHKYAWPLAHALRHSLPPSLPYPKHPDTPPQTNGSEFSVCQNSCSFVQ